MAFSGPGPWFRAVEGKGRLFVPRVDIPHRALFSGGDNRIIDHPDFWSSFATRLPTPPTQPLNLAEFLTSGARSNPLRPPESPPPPRSIFFLTLRFCVFPGPEPPFPCPESSDCTPNAPDPCPADQVSKSRPRTESFSVFSPNRPEAVREGLPAGRAEVRSTGIRSSFGAGSACARWMHDATSRPARRPPGRAVGVNETPGRLNPARSACPIRFIVG
jgi:hypothetical protein